MKNGSKHQIKKNVVGTPNIEWNSGSERQTKKIDDSKGPKGRVQWLWTPERKKMVMDQTKDRHEDSERRTKTATQNIK